MYMIRKALGLKEKSGTTKAIAYDVSNITYLNTPVIFYDWEAEDYTLKGYVGNSEVYKIIQKIIQKCAVAELELYVDNGSDKSRKRKKYERFKYSATPSEHVKKMLYFKALDYAPENSSLAKLIRKPNQTQTWRDMMELFRIFYFTQGEAFLARETPIGSKMPTEVWVVPPYRMRHFVKDGVIVAWEYDMGNGKYRCWADDTFDDVLHVKMSNPQFDGKGKQLRGMSPLLAGLKSLQLDDFAIEAWLKSLENEGAKGIISPNHPDKTNWLSPEQVKATELKVQEKIHGYENKNKVVVSGMPLQYTQIGLSPDALNIINSLEKAGNDLCDLWGVPAVLFDPNPTYQNQKEAGARFIRDVILPYLNKEEDALNRWLVEPFRKERNYILDYDTSLFDELRITMQDREYLERILTLNEMRIIEGYDEIENPYANEVFVEQGKIPLSDYGFGE
jgi:HK97 family phage portal protein